MPYQDEFFQQQVDAFREEMAAKAEFYNRHCAHQVGERLRQKLQEPPQAHWRIKSKRFLYRVRRWSSQLFLWVGQILVWSGQLVVKVGHWLDPNTHREKDVATSQEETVVDGAYQVIEARRENPYESESRLN